MRLSMGKRIGLGYLILILLFVGISLLGYFTINSIGVLAKVVKDNTEKNMFVVEREVDHLTWVQGLSLYLLSNQKFTGELNHTECRFGKWLYSEKTNDPELRRLLTEIKEPHRKLHESAKEILKFGERKDHEATLRVFLEQTIPALNKTKAILKQIRARFNQLTIETAGTAAKDMAAQVVKGGNSILILSIFAIIFGISITILVSKPILDTLKNIIQGLVNNMQQVAAASGQLSASAQQLSQGSSEQASAIEEVAATLEVTATMLQQNTANSKQAAQLTDQAKELADKGGLEMQEMMNSIWEIKKSSDQIAKIIKFIDDIAFQTNILALNAAIEAARAGDSGMGFAVVAEEVRNLAQKSAQAAKDTTDIVETNINLAGEGVAVTERVRGVFEEITVQTRKINELMAEIAAAGQEQVQGVSQINTAVSQVATVTQQNAASAEESAAAAEELSAQADGMQQIVFEIATLINGRAAALKMETAYSGQAGQLKQHPEPSAESVDHKTIVTPEDIIPLEKDSHHF